MSGNRTAEAVLEILARETFVQEHSAPSEDLARARGLWYRNISDAAKDSYRVRAQRLVVELAKSEIELTWRA